MIKITKKVAKLFNEVDSMNDDNLFFVVLSDCSLYVMYRDQLGTSILKSNTCSTTKELKKALKKLKKEAK